MRSKSAKTNNPPKKNLEPKNTHLPVIVGVGASAGGLEALRQFLKSLPSTTGMAFVLVQHLDPTRSSSLTEILSPLTDMKVLEAEDKMIPQPNHVYIIPPNASITLSKGLLRITPRAESPHPHMTVDLFLRALVDELSGRAIGVILSGTGSDGALGIKDIKEAGGITFAQDEKSAQYDGMPQSARSTGCVDFVLPPEQIAKEIAHISQHPYLASKGDGGPATQQELEEEGWRNILFLIREKKGVDLTNYKKNTIRRRILRRMALLKIENLESYRSYLLTHPQELQALYQDILIKVTCFFRDADAFLALKETVFPSIIKNLRPNAPLRIWVPGCSTGEEVYSIAIVLLECLGDRAANTRIQIFATDISETAIERARQGTYIENIELDVAPERLSRFFVKTDKYYQVCKSIRDMCVFATHDLLSDPPFSKMDFISCRNLLIYFEPVLQRRVMPIFHYALTPTGYLMLGESESTAAFSELFDAYDKKHKIYTRRLAANRMHFDFPAGPYMSSSLPPTKKNISVPSQSEVKKEFEKAVIDRYVPAGVIINDAMEILQFRGETRPYLKPPTGAPSFNLMKMADESLLVELRTAVRKAKETKKAVRKTDIYIRKNGKFTNVFFEVVPISATPDSNEVTFFVSFGQNAEPTVASKSKVSKDVALPGGAKKEAALKTDLINTADELERTKAYLQSILAEHEYANEELRAANEEILSSNEEFQSTNEELETAKEELQSTNEELSTVNDELRTRNSELTVVNTDITNVLSNIELPMVIIGSDLRIRRFTPSADKLFKLIPGDIGRAVTDIQTNMDVPNLMKNILDVMESAKPAELEVQSREGLWYALRIRPYRTHDNRIDGVMLLLQDIHHLKRDLQKSETSRKFVMSVLQTLRNPVFVLSSDFRIKGVNKAFSDLFQMSEHEIENMLLTEVGGGAWDDSKLQELLRNTLNSNKEFIDFRLDETFSKIGPRKFLVSARPIRLDSLPTESVLVSLEDVTWKKRTELGSLAEAAGDAILGLELNGSVTTLNAGAEAMFGLSSEKVEGYKISTLLPGIDWKERLQKVSSLKKGQSMSHEETEITTAQNGKKSLLVTVSPVLDISNQIVGASVIAHDNTERKNWEKDLLKMAGDLRRTNAELEQFTHIASHDLKEPLRMITAFASLLQQKSFDQLDKESQNYIHQMVDGAKTMQSLISGMLNFSEVDHIKEAFAPCDCNKILKDVLERHRDAIAEHKAEITFGPLPTILYDCTRLTQIFENLIRNALKFRSAANPKIHISAENRDRKWLFSIKDNGIGIDKDFHERIFQIFHRLHNRADYPGAGLGLALCRKIIESHGGKMWVESSEKEGSNFLFTVPEGNGR